MAVEVDGVAIERLRDHYKHCIRLSASNKINPKNAFDLQLIDYMQDLVSTAEDGQMNFKIASSALDVGAKIYSNRVDCIQSEAQKVASSILMALDGETKGNNDDSQLDANTSGHSDRTDDSRDENAQSRANKKKRSARNRNVKTVVEDTSLFDAKLEKMVLGDPFLDGLTQDFDMSCPAALISYNSLTQPSCLLTIESSHLRKDYRDASTVQSSNTRPASQPATSNDLSIIAEENTSESEDKTIEDAQAEKDTGDSQSTVNTSIEQVEQEVGGQQGSQQASCDKTSSTNSATGSLFQPPASYSTSHTSTDHHGLVTLVTKNLNCASIIRNNHHNRICPRLENFLFNDRTTAISGLDSSPDDTKLNMNENEINYPTSKTTGGAHEFNPELYDGNNDADDCGDDNFNDADSIVGAPGDENYEADVIPDLDKIAANKPTDYGYFSDHRLLNTWAGPQNWKTLKPILTAKKDAAPKSARKRVKLEQKPIDFGEEIDPTKEKLADKDIRISSDVIRRWKKPLLPQDHNLNEDSIRYSLSHTFLRPEDTYHCMKSPSDVLKLIDADHDYTKNNRNSEIGTPASPGLGAFDDVHDDSDDEFKADPIVDDNNVGIYGAPINDTLVHQADLEFAGENLIEQPYTVAQVNIPFAKIAKKMDVRKLKRVMWDLLLPPDKRPDMTMQVDGDKSRQEPNNNNNKQNGTNVAEDSASVEGEQNDTVIMANGTEETTTNNTSPAPSESAVHLEFSNLYCELPVRVSSKMANDLSQPIAFVTLLHLANEKNLKLIPKQDLRDFIIEQDDINCMPTS